MRLGGYQLSLRRDETGLCSDSGPEIAVIASITPGSLAEFPVSTDF